MILINETLYLLGLNFFGLKKQQENYDVNERQAHHPPRQKQVIR